MVMQMQAMHVAVNMNYIFYIKAQYKCTHCATVCNLIVIFTDYMRRGGEWDEIWLNI